ncbi:MAG TPA: HEAT repeat domain-containing protein [Terriglobales bacterium]|nr:HEAT repeat domain-containing protein [Terriglobales bacterium]
MKCEEFANLGADYLKKNLPSGSMTAMEEHRQQCAECGAQVAMWQKLGSLPELEASPAMQARFDAMLNAFEEGQRVRSGYNAAIRDARPSWSFGEWFRMPLAQAAAFVLVLVAGFAAGKLTNTPAAPQTNGELAELRQELKETRQLAVHSLLSQQSASDRLQGISYGTRSDKADPEILTALLQTLRSDKSVDVRLAALDALRRYNTQPDVRQGVVDALSAQNSPMVQIAIIDMMVELREARAVQQIKKLEERPDLNPAVRQRARSGLTQLQG